MIIRYLCVLLIVVSCISTKEYAKAESNRCDCLSGIKEPADEFCQEWSEKVNEEWTKLESKLLKVKGIKRNKLCKIENDIKVIQVQRDSCLSKISKYY